MAFITYLLTDTVARWHQSDSAQRQQAAAHNRGALTRACKACTVAVVRWKRLPHQDAARWSELRHQRATSREEMVAVGKKRLNGTLDTPPTPSRRDRRRAIEHYRHPSGEPLPGGPLPVSEWPAALARFSVLEPYGATCYFSYFTESIGWSYHRQNSPTSPGECAAACLKTNGCTGFEFPNNAEYCALWYRGNCDRGAACKKSRVGGALAAAAACQTRITSGGCHTGVQGGSGCRGGGGREATHRLPF